MSAVAVEVDAAAAAVRAARFAFGVARSVGAHLAGCAAPTARSAVFGGDASVDAGSVAK
jgi:hypothetical protein